MNTNPKSLLAPRLLTHELEAGMAAAPDDLRHVIVEVNAASAQMLPETRESIRTMIRNVASARCPQDQGACALRRDLPAAMHPYVFAELTAGEITSLLEIDGTRATAAARAAGAASPRAFRAIFKIWDSKVMKPMTTVSIRTVKADAAHSAFSALGDDVVWAVLDSGIDRTHPHFATYGNLNLAAPLRHKDFRPSAALDKDTADDALRDDFGHGTHCAGIIAGGSCASPPGPAPKAALQSLDESGTKTEYAVVDVKNICGMAPRCKLLSLRILDERGDGDDTAAINAMEYVMQLNAYGANVIVHGINISAGYLPDIANYATGQTPICRMVDRLVDNGVCVVVAAGNTGYVVTNALENANVVPFNAAQLGSINDPGNAALAITVGSTHREKPHTFGISYFSSKGPTADGRAKPDLVAPGEKIISCAAGSTKALVSASLLQAVAEPAAAAAPEFGYLEDSGTSMAAPHVSGILAAFLSVRPEFRGEAQRLRDIVIGSAVDLGRDARMQGAGLADLMKMLQSQ